MSSSEESYFYRLQAGEFVETKNLVIFRRVIRQRVLVETRPIGIACILILCIRFSACTDVGPDPEEYAVYAAVIDSMYAHKDTAFILIEDTTSWYINFEKDWNTFFEFVGRFASGVTRETLDDFRRINTRSHQLEKNFTLSVDYELINLDEMAETLGRNGARETFLSMYNRSEGIVELSRVGFDPLRTQALVYVGNYPRESAGKGNYVLLSRSNDKWKVQKVILVWLSAH